jgi:hypothetical protein
VDKNGKAKSLGDTAWFKMTLTNNITTLFKCKVKNHGMIVYLWIQLHTIDSTGRIITGSTTNSSGYLLSNGSLPHVVFKDNDFGEKELGVPHLSDPMYNWMDALFGFIDKRSIGWKKIKDGWRPDWEPDTEGRTYAMQFDNPEGKDITREIKTCQPTAKMLVIYQ